jgi:hypothetical protein
MIGLALVAILAMGLIVIAGQFRDRPEPDNQVGQAVLKDLKARLDDVVRLRLSSGGVESSLERHDEGWQVVEKDGYPVKFEKLSGFLIGLAGATYVERKTSRPENFATLGVSDVTEQDSTSLLVRIETGAASANESLGEKWQLLIGDQSAGMSGRFVREPGLSQVWLASGIGVVDSAPEKWIDDKILHIDAEHVSRTNYTAETGDTLVAMRDEESDEFVLVNVPEGAELKYDTIAGTLARALVNVSAIDVRKRIGSWENVSTAEFRIDDGSRIMVYAMTEETGEHWLRVDVSAAEVPIEAVSALHQGRLASWEFRVAEHTWEQFTRTMDDMIESGTQES